jgi:hypothetical protein
MMSFPPPSRVVALRFFCAGLLGAIPLIATACGGSVNASAKAKASSEGEGEGETNFGAEGDAAWDLVDASQSEKQTAQTASPSVPTSAASTPKAESALFGARHDLTIAPGASTQCPCINVVLGPPTHPGLTWSGQAPVINPTTQLIVGLSSDQVACTEAGPGASYMGYESIDGNVVITVEAAVPGRPVTHGAIIPRPAVGKQVLLKPSGKIPYGRGPGGAAECALGRGQ